MYHQQKNRLKNILFSSTSLTLIGFLIMLLICIPLARNIQKQLSVNQEIVALDQEIESLEKKNTDLKGLISYLNSDQFAEEQAKLNLNYKMKGEELVIIKDKNSVEGEQTLANNQAMTSIYNIEGLASAQKVIEKSNYEKWFKYFWK